MEAVGSLDVLDCLIGMASNWLGSLWGFKGCFFIFKLVLGLSAVLGVFVLFLAVLLHGWTAKLIGLKATIGYTELKSSKNSSEQSLITSGPFSVVRHPSYCAHIAIDVGFYLITRIVAIGIIALIDLAIIYIVVTPLEDRELVSRFGERYVMYQQRVPRFFPKIKNSL